jgi:hypothetical protein
LTTGTAHTFSIGQKVSVNLKNNAAFNGSYEIHGVSPVTVVLARTGFQPVGTMVVDGPEEGSIGAIAEMSRNKVDDNPDSHCSYGLHAGALSYVASYGSGGHLIIVKIHPKDAVSVPKDANCTKLRTCRLEVIGEYVGELNQSLYTSTGEPSTPSSFDEDDDNDEEEYEEGYGDDEDFDDDDDDDDDDEGYDDDDDEGYDDDDDDEPVATPPQVQPFVVPGQSAATGLPTPVEPLPPTVTPQAPSQPDIQATSPGGFAPPAAAEPNEQPQTTSPKPGFFKWLFKE